MNKLYVNSEINPLKTVLVHKPGDELLHLTPDWLTDLLFDDIPWLIKAREEHEVFQDAMRSEGIEVLELIDLVVESLKDSKTQKLFIEKFLDESLIEDDITRKKIKQFLKKLELHQMVAKTMSGVLKSDLKPYRKHRLKDYIQDYPFMTDPMPNLYFTRDPFTVIDEMISIHKMDKKARQRESLYGEFIYKYHPRFSHLKQIYNRDETFSLEGGDILNINSKVLLIGMSERTEPEAIEIIASNLLKHTNYKLVLAVLLPKKRTFMHLDTVFTQVDQYTFVIHPEFLKTLKIYEIYSQNDEKTPLKIHETETTIQKSLMKHLNHDIKMIPCGGKNLLSADREQWNDGANVFAISPGVVIAYERNDLTNKKLEEHGIKVIRIPSSELSRGRGGPRCMTMPLSRF